MWNIFLISLVLATTATGTNLRQAAATRTATTKKEPSPILQKPELFAIQGPEGPNNFSPEALPIWMRPKPPGGDGGGAAIGAAASANTPATTEVTKGTTLKQKFGDVSQSRFQSRGHHHHHHHHHHQHHLKEEFDSAGEDGEAEAPAAGGAASAGGVPTEGIPQGPAGGAPSQGPLPPALPANPQVGMMFPAGMFDGGMLGSQQGPPPGSSTVDMGTSGTTPFHISTAPMSGGILSGSKIGPSDVVSPISPSAPGPVFK